MLGNVLFYVHIYHNNVGNDLLTKVIKGHPFTYNVMAIPVPATFKPFSSLESYVELIDPQEHLKGFCITMLLFDTLDTIMCQDFSTILRKAIL